MSWETKGMPRPQLVLTARVTCPRADCPWAYEDTGFEPPSVLGAYREHWADKHKNKTVGQIVQTWLDTESAWERYSEDLETQQQTLMVLFEALVAEGIVFTWQAQT